MANGIDTSGIDKGEDISIQEKDVTLTISKNSNQKNEINSKTNKTNINFGECEKKVKAEYNIPESESLYIFKMDVKQEGYKIPKMLYEVYYPLYNDSKLYLLNLSICGDISIDVYFPLSFNGSLDEIDPNSDFYNDICNTYTSENGTDLTLAERKNNYIKNNLAVCEENCEFMGYNKTTEKAICSCQVKTDFITQISENIFNKEKLYEAFTDFKNIFNIRILKCTDLIFSVKAFKENYANVILISIILLYFVCLIIFVCKYYDDDIKYYKDCIMYFTLASAKITYIIQKKKKEEKKKKSEFFRFKKNTNNNINNITNNVSKVNNFNDINFQRSSKNLKIKGKNKIKKPKKETSIRIIEQPTFQIILDKKKELLKKNKKSNPIKRKVQSNLITSTGSLGNERKTRDELIKKIKLEEKNIEKYKDIFKKFNELTEEQIYELHKKIYTKTDREINTSSYNEALKYDNRSYFIYYFSLIKTKHLLFFSFLPKFDFNSKILKIFLFFFNFTTYFFVNALFFTDKTMGKINKDGGSFNFIYNLPQIIYSNLISSFINEIVKILALTENNFIEYRNAAKKENIAKTASALINNLKIKFLIFYILDLTLLVLFWIYLSCFSAVYKNTQLHLIKDTLISFGTSFITPFVIYLFPGIFRIPSLKNKDRRILYGISQVLQLL